MLWICDGSAWVVDPAKTLTVRSPILGGCLAPRVYLSSHSWSI